MLRLLTTILIAVVLLSCATPYQQEGFGGGYSETQLAPNIFRVTFKGNAKTSEGRAADFALLRSAEIAVELGFEYFVVVDESLSTKDAIVNTPGTATTYWSGSGYGGYSGTTTYTPGTSYVISKPSATNTIVLLKDKPEVKVFVYDAKYLINSLKTKYEIELR